MSFLQGPSAARHADPRQALKAHVSYKTAISNIKRGSIKYVPLAGSAIAARQRQLIPQDRSENPAECRQNSHGTTPSSASDTPNEQADVEKTGAQANQFFSVRSGSWQRRRPVRPKRVTSFLRSEFLTPDGVKVSKQGPMKTPRAEATEEAAAAIPQTPELVVRGTTHLRTPPLPSSRPAPLKPLAGALAETAGVPPISLNMHDGKVLEDQSGCMPREATAAIDKAPSLAPDVAVCGPTPGNRVMPEEIVSQYRLPNPTAPPITRISSLKLAESLDPQTDTELSKDDDNDLGQVEPKTMESGKFLRGSGSKEFPRQLLAPAGGGRRFKANILSLKGLANAKGAQRAMSESQLSELIHLRESLPKRSASLIARSTKLPPGHAQAAITLLHRMDTFGRHRIFSKTKSCPRASTQGSKQPTIKTQSIHSIPAERPLASVGLPPLNSISYPKLANLKARPTQRMERERMSSFMLPVRSKTDRNRHSGLPQLLNVPADDRTIDLRGDVDSDMSTASDGEETADLRGPGRVSGFLRESIAAHIDARKKASPAKFRSSIRASLLTFGDEINVAPTHNDAARLEHRISTSPLEAVLSWHACAEGGGSSHLSSERKWVWRRKVCSKCGTPCRCKSDAVVCCLVRRTNLERKLHPQPTVPAQTLTRFSREQRPLVVEQPAREPSSTIAYERPPREQSRLVSPPRQVVITDFDLIPVSKQGQHEQSSAREDDLSVEDTHSVENLNVSLEAPCRRRRFQRAPNPSSGSRHLVFDRWYRAVGASGRPRGVCRGVEQAFESVRRRVVFGAPSDSVSTASSGSDDSDYTEGTVLFDEVVTGRHMVDLDRGLSNELSEAKDERRSLSVLRHSVTNTALGRSRRSQRKAALKQRWDADLAELSVIKRNSSDESGGTTGVPAYQLLQLTSLKPAELLSRPPDGGVRVNSERTIGGTIPAEYMPLWHLENALQAPVVDEYVGGYTHVRVSHL